MKYKAITVLRMWEAEQRANPQTTPFQMAIRLGFTERVFLANLESAKRELAISGKVEFSLGTPLHLTGDYMVIGDVHVPFTDYEWAVKVAQVARKHLKKPRRLIIAGDFFNMDAFSTYAHLTNIPTWAQEREAAKGLLHEWLDTFQDVTMLMGNHDRRLQKFTGGAFDETDIFGMVISNPALIRSSNFGYCTLESAGQVYRITHPKNYSINQLNVAEALAQKHSQNIISFHEHHLSIGWDRYKRYLIVNGGSLVDTDKLAYARLDDSKAAGMAKGFVMLKGGTPYLFGEPPFTDWSVI